jgi:hypothetical protein
MQEPKIPSQHVDEQEMDGEQKPPTATLQENAQEIIEEAKQDIEAARLPWYLTIRRGQVLLVSAPARFFLALWHGGYITTPS